MMTRYWCAFVLGMMVSSAAAQEKPLPKVVLVGDSIRMGYAPFVAKLLAGKATVVSPAPNGEDSGNVLRHLDEWVVNEKPDVVHINAGLHDLKLKDKSYQVPLTDYEKNLKTILERIQRGTKARVIFATTTPIVDNLHAQRKAGFDRFEADVKVQRCGGVGDETGRRTHQRSAHAGRRRRQAKVDERRRHALHAGRLRNAGPGGDRQHPPQPGPVKPIVHAKLRWSQHGVTELCIDVAPSARVELKTRRISRARNRAALVFAGSSAPCVGRVRGPRRRGASSDGGR